MLRVWFNHWFSTSYNIIHMMKEDPEEKITVIGSNLRINSVISKACDEWYEEPSLNGDAYINFCLDFCKKHFINVFVPRRNMVEISKNRSAFHAIGVKVMVDDYSKIDILNNKARTYDLLKTIPEIHVPDFAVVTNAAEFEEAYGRLQEKYLHLCIKFVQDEGGMSFRRIVQEVNRFDALSEYPVAGISLTELTETLKEKERFQELMVMPYLSGEEISVDCLNTAEGLIAVPRFKGDSRDERIEFDENITDMCRKILDVVMLEYPCNIQFKMLDHIPYLLEINTRMSGGLQMSCVGAQVNIPNIALNILYGKKIPWTLKRHNCVVSYIEMPQIISENQ